MQSGARTEAGTGFACCAIATLLSGLVRKGADDKGDGKADDGGAVNNADAATVATIQPLQDRVEVYEALSATLPLSVLEEIMLAEMAAGDLRANAHALAAMRQMSGINEDGIAPDDVVEGAYRETLKRTTLGLAIKRLSLSLNGTDFWDPWVEAGRNTAGTVDEGPEI